MIGRFKHMVAGSQADKRDGLNGVALIIVMFCLSF